MRKESARAARFKHDLSLVILDIDNFKQVNDTHGHLQGDEVLRVIGKILAEESRGIDAPARYGGEEFVVALPETDTEGALEVAERIRERIEAASIPMVEARGRDEGHGQHRHGDDAGACPPTCRTWSRRPTARCMRRSAPARTGSCVAPTEDGDEARGRGRSGRRFRRDGGAGTGRGAAKVGRGRRLGAAPTKTIADRTAE